MKRRTFLHRSLFAGTATALGARSYAQVSGANERVNVGLIGFGLIGRFHLAAIREQPDARVAAVCDVHRGRVEQGVAMAGGDARGFGDFRRMLAEKSVDAVYVATPDHWHALMTMLACVAGKDVYVEKPTHLFVREGRWMLDVMKRTGHDYFRSLAEGTPFPTMVESIRAAR